LKQFLEGSQGSGENSRTGLYLDPFSWEVIEEKCKAVQEIVRSF
jgi:hypothetical protein